MTAMAYDIFVSKSNGRNNFILSFLSKWAMLDVLIISIMVASMKSEMVWQN
ncbi:MAG: paraquat-inducible protein A [Bacteroidetes bacterium]|nr:paraquat-inducible protein A [Bacteroidota bacterium]